MPRALISVTDKTGIVEFASALNALGFEIVSTGGTAKALKASGLQVVEVEEVTGFPEMLDGRVKTLHPLVHGGLLGDRRNPAHVAAMSEAGIVGFDVLCVNLYRFEETVTGEHSRDQAIESIDIGGPAMIRAAAKNHANVLVVVDPRDYDRVLQVLSSGIDESSRLHFAAAAFRHTAYYDSVVARYLTGLTGSVELPELVTIGMRGDGRPLRYGENPHQVASRYIDPLRSDLALSVDESAAGKEISYNNWLDADAAWGLVQDLPAGSCAIIKHGNPCGAAKSLDLGASYRLARESDRTSAFGGIVAFGGEIDETAVEAMTEAGNFLEVVVSLGWKDPGLYERFLAGSAWTKNVRFLRGSLNRGVTGVAVRSLAGSFLVQDQDVDPGDSEWKVATKREPTPEEWESLRFVWSIVPHVKSNAIVVGSGTRMLGVGAGQMNRVQSVRLALEQAGHGAEGAVLASDAFFPFSDSIETASASGIRAVIQPGGSKKDAEVVEKANELGMAMVFTGTRHFRH